MTQVEGIVSRISRMPDCALLPPSGIPVVQPDHVLPKDVSTFYQLCGGAILYERSEFSIQIVRPEHFVLANPVILVGLNEEQLNSTKHEISWSWYIVGQGEGGEYILIDLHPMRLGRCYYSFWDRHAMEGYSPVIATSFTDLMIRLLNNKGLAWYWEQSDFESMGDAYE